MTTRVPRISITPSGDLRALLEELASLSGQSLSSVAVELLDEIVPVMRGQLEAMKKIAAAPDKARELMQDYAARGTLEIAQTMIQFEEHLDSRTVEGKRQKRRAARAHGPSKP